MAKLPGVLDLGGLPSADATRPVGGFDGGAVARAGAAVAEAGKQLGAGIGKLGEGMGELAIDKNRWDYAKAHSDFLTNKIALDNDTARDTHYGPDDDGKTLPQRYQQKLGELRDRSAALIPESRMRERFVTEMAPTVAKGVASADSHARKLEGEANTAYVQKQGDTFIDQGVQATDDETRRQVIDSHNQLVDGLLAKGTITAPQALQMKREWAHQFATAAGLHLADTEPEAAINLFRAKPGSPEGVTARIMQIEGQGKNPRSSATGTGQFIDSTWLDVLKRNRPDLASGKSDEDLLALRADRNLGKDMTAAYQRENSAFLQRQGLEATPGNVYLAHFLGPAGAAAVLKADPRAPIADVLASAKEIGPLRARAMIEANPSILGGQLAGSVRQWADSKMGGQVPGGGSIYDILRPDIREQVLARAQAAQHKRDVDDLTGFKTRFQDTTTEAMNTGTVAKPMTAGEFVAALGADVGPTAHKQYQAQLQLGADIAKVAELDPDEQQKLLDSYKPEAGSAGYAEQSKRQAELAKAIERDQKMRAKDPDWKQRIETSIAEAGRTGAASKPVTQKEFEQRLGKEEGGKAFAHYSTSLRLGHDVQHIGELGPAEQNELLKGYEPVPGSEDYLDAGKRYDALQKAIGHIGMERGKDPAAFAINRLPVVSEAYAKLVQVMADPTAPLEAKQAAAREFATKMEMEQARIGVPAEKRTLLPQEYVDQFNAKLSKPAAAGGTINVVGMIENEAKIWGDNWPQVYRQMSKGAAPVVMVIGSGVKPAAAQILTEFANTKLADIANDQSEERLSTIRKDVRDAFRPLSRSMAGNEGTQQTIDGFQAAGEKLAAYYVRGGKTSSDAAKQAFDDLLGHKYDFNGESYRVPKSIPFTASQIALGVTAATFKMGELDLAPARDTVGGLSPEYLKRETVRAYARDGRWVTAPDESGLALIYKDQAVRRADGRPLVLSWEQLARMGKDAAPEVPAFSFGG